MTGRSPELNFFSLPFPMKVEATGAIPAAASLMRGSGEAVRERPPV